MDRIVIKHLNGARANQEESFSLDKFIALTIGRDPTLDVKFDPNDDVVSRNHAKIERDSADGSKFRLTDTGSRNGVFINGAKITKDSDLHHGDVVRLGPGGPEFLFNLDPPPAAALKATRVVETAAAMKTTREATVTSVEPPPARPGVGRETVERMVSAAESSSKKQMINWVAGLVGVVVLASGGLFWYQKKQAADTATIIESDKKQRAEEAGKKFDATRIAADYGGSTVYIEASWKLIDVRSKKAVYHQYELLETEVGGKKSQQAFPMYVRLADGSIEPFLTLNDRAGRVVGGTHTGSGFVVTDNGFILTNRHVAAAWVSNGIAPLLPLPGLLIKEEGGKLVRALLEDTPQNRDQLRAWVPARSKQAGRPWDPKNLVGENQYFDVTFAKSKTRTPARIVKISDEADTALIKIDTPNALKPVQLAPADSYETLKQGESIIVLGYPGVSPNVFVRTESQDPFVNAPTVAVVPDNTVSVGAIGRLIRGSQAPAGGSKNDYVSQFGDMYQLTINSTGPGNSGGPAFDERGRVIGIYSAGGGGISFAVPIKYGLDLMDIKPVIK